METGQAGSERRRQARKISTVNKLTQIEIADEGGHPEVFYAYLVDISLGGLRVNLDQHFETGRTLEFELNLAGFGPALPARLALRVRVVWTERLPGGTWVHGCQILYPSEEVTATLERMMTNFGGGGKRRFFRLGLPLAFATEIEGQSRMLFARDLSVQGMGFRCKQRLQPGQRLPVTLQLPDRRSTTVVETHMVVAWSHPAPDDTLDVGCYFDGLSDFQAAQLARCVRTQSRL
ncbi:MAG: PilZ domain-containing protein [Vulcanimicrobiota bacterium]